MLSSGKDFNNLQYMCIHYELLANMLVALIIMCVAAMQPRYKAVAEGHANVTINTPPLSYGGLRHTGMCYTCDTL